MILKHRLLGVYLRRYYTYFYMHYELQTLRTLVQKWFSRQKEISLYIITGKRRTINTSYILEKSCFVHISQCLFKILRLHTLIVLPITTPSSSLLGKCGWRIIHFSLSQTPLWSFCPFRHLAYWNVRGIEQSCMSCQGTIT